MVGITTGLTAGIGGIFAEEEELLNEVVAVCEEGQIEGIFGNNEGLLEMLGEIERLFVGCGDWVFGFGENRLGILAQPIAQSFRLLKTRTNRNDTAVLR
jgi:hypothetical protein